MKKKILILLMILCSTSLANVHADDARDSTTPPEMDFSGTTPTYLEYHGLSYGKIPGCIASVVTIITAGLYCFNDMGPWTIEKTSGEDVDTNVIVKTWGEGKVLVTYALGKAQGCAGIQRTYVGYATAYQAYNLYELSGAKTDVNPVSADAAGALSISRHGADLKLFQNIHASTQDGDGRTCNWLINRDAVLSFKLDSSN